MIEDQVGDYDIRIGSQKLTYRAEGLGYQDDGFEFHGILNSKLIPFDGNRALLIHIPISWSHYPYNPSNPWGEPRTDYFLGLTPYTVDYEEGTITRTGPPQYFDLDTLYGFHPWFQMDFGSYSSNGVQGARALGNKAIIALWEWGLGYALIDWSGTTPFIQHFVKGPDQTAGFGLNDPAFMAVRNIDSGMEFYYRADSGPNFVMSRIVSTGSSLTLTNVNHGSISMDPSRVRGFGPGIAVHSNGRFLYAIPDQPNFTVRVMTGVVGQTGYTHNSFSIPVNPDHGPRPHAVPGNSMSSFESGGDLYANIVVPIARVYGTSFPFTLQMSRVALRMNSAGTVSFENYEYWDNTVSQNPLSGQAKDKPPFTVWSRNTANQTFAAQSPSDIITSWDPTTFPMSGSNPRETHLTWDAAGERALGFQRQWEPASQGGHNLRPLFVISMADSSIPPLRLVNRDDGYSNGPLIIRPV